MDIRRIENSHAFPAQMALDQEAVGIGAVARGELRDQPEPGEADGQIERSTPGKRSTAPGVNSTASMMASPMLTTRGIESLEIGVAVEHRPMRVRHLPSQREHHAVEQDQAALLEQAAANCAVFSTGTGRARSASLASVPSGLWVSVTT